MLSTVWSKTLNASASPLASVMTRSSVVAASAAKLGEPKPCTAVVLVVTVIGRPGNVLRATAVTWTIVPAAAV